MNIEEQYISYNEGETLSIVEAKYIGDFGIRITFSDGRNPLVDFKPFLENAKHPSIRKYLEESKFRQFTIKEGNLDWNDFDLCFSLEDLYHNQLVKPIPQASH